MNSAQTQAQSLFNQIIALCPAQTAKIQSLETFIVGELGKPPVPANFVATGGFAANTLSWSAVAGATYQLYRCTTANGTYSLITSNITMTTYRDTKATLNQITYYKIKSVVGGVVSNTAMASATATSVNYFISTTGKDTNDGKTPTSAFATLTKAVSVVVPGNVVQVLAGTYHQACIFNKTGTSTAPITFQADTSGPVVFDGTGLPSGPLFKPGMWTTSTDSGKYITLKGFIIDNVTNGYGGGAGAVVTNDNWTLDTITVQNSTYTGMGLDGIDVVVKNCVTQFNGQEGWQSSNSQNLLIQNSITRWNNLNALVNPAVEAGGGKFAGCNGTTLDGVEAYGNVGPGIWFDWNNSNITIQNCHVYGNVGVVGGSNLGNVNGNWIGAGIAIEISQGPVLIQNNTIYGNSGAAIGIWESTNVTAQNNIIGFNTWAVDLRDMPTRGIHIANINVTHNQFVWEPLPAGQWWQQAAFASDQGGVGTGPNGPEDTTWHNNSGVTKNIVIDYNDYENGGPMFWWSDSGNYKQYNTIASVQTTLGFEAHGTVGAKPTPIFPALPPIPTKPV